MNIKNKGIIHLLPLILVGGLIVAVAVGAYYLSKNSGQQIITRDTYDGNTNNWRTVTFDFGSLKIPQDWHTCKQEGREIVLSKYFSEDAIVDHPDNCISNSSSLGKDLSTISIKYNKDTDLKNDITSRLGYEEIEIDGIKAYQADLLLESYPAKYSISTYLPEKEILISMAFNMDGGTDEELSKQIYNQILSTFKFSPENENDLNRTDTPTGWFKKNYDEVSLSLYLPNDWQSKIEQFEDVGSTLISMKKNSWDSYPVQLSITSNWSNTGNAESLERNYLISGNILAAKVDPPKKEYSSLERYQTSYYFEYKNKVYSYHCVHNWEAETIETCENILANILWN